ncbi:MAG: SlyX family protein [Proteobacteria bacterium]|nr:SlyX family protein [Pseudomonadota bacterium]
MSEAIEEQITRLEMLWAEQEHTLQALNEVVSRQDRELSRIKNELKLLTQQYQTLKSHLPDQLDPVEKPPHY